MEKYYFVELGQTTENESEINDLAYKKFECQGIEEFSIDEARVDEILGERSYSGADLPQSVIDEVEAVLNSDKLVKKYHFLKEDLATKFSDYLAITYDLGSKVNNAKNQDWNSEWRKSYAAIEVAKDFKIIPAWEKELKSSVNDIYIYPGMGFGTGGHETTFLCMQLYFEKIDKLSTGSSCLDFGCGSGILGIAFQKHLDSVVDLYDIDQAALDNCIQNIELNELEKSNFNLLLPKERKKIEKKYDFVFANILENVLMLEKTYLANSLTPGGTIILSGLLKGQQDNVIHKYLKENPGLKHIETRVKGDWVAIELELKLK